MDLREMLESIPRQLRRSIYDRFIILAFNGKARTTAPGQLTFAIGPEDRRYATGCAKPSSYRQHLQALQLVWEPEDGVHHSFKLIVEAFLDPERLYYYRLDFPGAPPFSNLATEDTTATPVAKLSWIQHITRGFHPSDIHIFMVMGHRWPHVPLSIYEIRYWHALLLMSDKVDIVHTYPSGNYIVEVLD